MKAIQLLQLVTSTKHTIGCFDKHIGGGSHCLGSGDQPFCPTIVSFVESSPRTVSFALGHNLKKMLIYIPKQWPGYNYLFLRDSGSLEELSNCIRNCNCSVQD